MGHRRSDAVHCGATECANTRARENYSARLVEKPCARCGELFTGTDKSVHCGCAYNKQYTRFNQEHRCRVCDELIETKSVNRTNTPSPIMRLKICDACRVETPRRMAESKLGERNPNWKGGQKPRMTKQEFSEHQSQRMTTRNPMFDNETRQKVSRSLQSRDYSSWPRGKQHWLWKGNRLVLSVLRTSLGSWRREVMVRDCWMCSHCGSKTRLEVHHLIPFATIVNSCLITLGLGDLSKMDVNSEEFTRLQEAVLAAHVLEIGLTLCAPCHAAADAMRRPG